MSLIDILLQRRRSSAAWVQVCHPRFEVLEERQCMSVAGPTGLHAVAISSTQVKLTWNAVAGATGYKIYHWDGTESVLAGSVAKTITTFAVGSLPSDMTEWFSVQAHDLSTSAQSSWVSVATLADAITAPTNLKLTNITQTTMTLTWANAAGATGYNVYGWNGTRAILLGAVAVTPLIPSTPTFKATGLTQGIVYYFYVQAFNNTNSATTGWVSGTTLSNGLATPGNVKTQVIGPSTIGLSWNDVTGETGFNVYGWDGNSADTPILLAKLSVHTTGYQAIGLQPGQEYWFYVQAFNGANFANSGWVTATTVVALPLQAPTQLTFNVTGGNNVTLSWVESARAVGYNVYMWSGYSWVLATTVPAGTHSVPINGLAINRTYWFYVQAFTDNDAEIADSNTTFVNL